MGLWDLLELIADNLGRRKARVALTAVGVVIGTAAIVVLVSLAIGLQMDAAQRLGGIGDLTQIQVMPNYGPGPSGPSGGGGGAGVSVVSKGGSPTKQILVTNQTITALKALPNVTGVIARDFLQGGSMITYGRLQTGGSIIGVGTADLTDLGLKVKQGSLKLERGTAVIGPMVSSGMMNPNARAGQASQSPPDLFGATLKLTLIKNAIDGTEVRKTVALRVGGIIAESRGESDYSIYLPLDDVTGFNEWFLGKRINRQRDGFGMAIVKVSDVSKVLAISDQITAMGYQAFTPQSFVQGINGFYVVLQVIFGGVGAISLLVAAIGIANTMAMAILERTREIGLMKAVGATNRDVLSVFLGEAAGIGFIGGLGGVLVGWSAGQVINVLALAYLAGQAVKSGGPPPTIAVYTPLWLPIFTLIFATLIGLLSGLYPALRAATLVPVNALKYE
jgi:putative ABC transport system permease protein